MRLNWTVADLFASEIVADHAPSRVMSAFTGSFLVSPVFGAGSAVSNFPVLNSDKGRAAVRLRNLTIGFK
jgi:hypothetical protein